MATTYDVPYMRRTRDYYRALGYSRDYRWAHHEDAPFQSLAKPIAASTLAVITTAMPDTEAGRQQRAVYSTPVTPEPDSMYTAELAWDKTATHTDDVNSFLPLRQLQRLVAADKLGALAQHFHSVPTTYSQRETVETDAPEILRRCQQDSADIVLLVPL